MKRFAYFQLFFVIAAVVFTTCRNPKDSLNEEKQLEEQQKIFLQEVQKFDISYVFEIDSFKYLEEFPRTIAGIKALYYDESFIEKTSKNDLKGFLGSYWYTLSSPNVIFSFLGDTMEDANLLIATITHLNYQCKTMQVIGMSVEQLEHVSGKRLTQDKTIRISTELYILIIETNNGIVSSYTILEQL